MNEPRRFQFAVTDGGFTEFYEVDARIGQAIRAALCSVPDSRMQITSALGGAVRTAKSLPDPAAAREIRCIASVSQQKVADELGVHRVTIARWEDGTRKPRGNLLVAYLKVLTDLQEEA